MEQRNFGYSMKNIPVAGKNAYMKRMVEKVESVLRRMRWKALFFEKPAASGPGINTYGFKSTKAPPPMQHLNAFENDLYDLLRNIQFTTRRNGFQKQLAKDVKEIARSKDVLVSADKTTNLYSTTTEAYRKLLNENITRSYKTASKTVKQGIDREASKIASGLDIAERVEIYAEKDAFITLKDHKEDFRTRPSCRLINPAKSEIGIISKQMVEDINSRVRAATKPQQWRDTQAVINWFKNLPEREKLSFIKFDIVEFYPSISEELLRKTITFARKHTTITKQEEEVIWHSRKSLLFGGSSTWQKKDGNQFDVTMGSYDGAEICELVGLYILDLLSCKFNRELIGLYRDDGLAALKLSGPQADRARKDIVHIFKQCGLRVTVDILLKQTDFLDVTFDLVSGKFWPYRKPNSDPLYINAKSNHPPTILKHLPAAITSRIASLSCSEEEFSKATPAYKEALQKSGYNDDMPYTEQRRSSKRQRKRGVIWFNPPYNQSVTTNVAAQFLKLVDKHFPRHHRYYKLFNRSNVKCSYSCMNNIGSIIRSHNAKVLAPTATNTTTPPRTCNCRQPQNCPLGGMCLTQCIVYKATVSAPNKPTQVYYGLTEGAFKTRFNNHAQSFRVEKHRRVTELSKYMWDLKDLGLEGEVRWEIAKRAGPYKCGARRCDLCLTEKMVIAAADPATMLNKRSELVSTCRHRAKFRCDKV